MRQTVMTIITEIDPNKRGQLEWMLTEIRHNLSLNAYIPFSSISLLHFASFVIANSGTTQYYLIFENNFDGPVSGYLDELLSVAGPGLDKLYRSCPSYQSSDYKAQKLKEFLAARVVRPNAYHIGNVGRAAVNVRGNSELREMLQTYLDRLFTKTKPADITANKLRDGMQGFLRTNASPNLLRPLTPNQTFLEKVMPSFWLAIAGISALMLVLGLLPIVLVLLYILRKKEKTDEAQKELEPLSHVNMLMSTENLSAQNHLANITTIKPGSFRLYTLKIVLFAANLLARTSNKGKLSGIPSIHFAHWSIINNRQLLFLSNFDSSWSSYLDDFIDKASLGLTGIWSNTVGFPKTRFLVLDGARDEARFKAFARSMQVPSLVWYSAYPNLTVQNIDKDSAVREDVLSELSDLETKKWLKLF